MSEPYNPIVHYRTKEIKSGFFAMASICVGVAVIFYANKMAELFNVGIFIFGPAEDFNEKYIRVGTVAGILGILLAKCALQTPTYMRWLAVPGIALNVGAIVWVIGHLSPFLM